MPHVIYLHSALMQHRVPVRTDEDRLRVLRFQRWDVAIAMGLAGITNMAMLIVAASLFHDPGLTGIESIDDAHAAFGDLVGPGAALAFALALLAPASRPRASARSRARW